LVNDVIDPDDIPDTIYSSLGTSEPVVAHRNGTVNLLSNNALSINVTLIYNQWVYIRLEDPVPQGTYVTSIVRSDGKPILVGYNCWRTYRVFRTKRAEERIESFIHILDYNSTGNYEIEWESLLPPSNLKVDVSTNSTLEFSWEMAPGATNHRIMYKPAHEINYILATASTPATAYTLVDLEPGSAYHIRFTI
jgi:hypothetical protein